MELNFVGSVIAIAASVVLVVIGGAHGVAPPTMSPLVLRRCGRLSDRRGRGLCWPGFPCAATTLHIG